MSTAILVVEIFVIHYLEQPLQQYQCARHAYNATLDVPIRQGRLPMVYRTKRVST